MVSPLFHTNWNIGMRSYWKAEEEMLAVFLCASMQGPSRCQEVAELLIVWLLLSYLEWMRGTVHLFNNYLAPWDESLPHQGSCYFLIVFAWPTRRACRALKIFLVFFEVVTENSSGLEMWRDIFLALLSCAFALILPRLKGLVNADWS